MPFTNSLPEWNSTGTEPPQSLKDSGWAANQKPPADYFNWFFNVSFLALKELHDKGYTQDDINQLISNVATTALNNLTAHTDRHDNPHAVTAEQAGAVPTTDVVTAAAANKLLKLDSNSKLPTSITGNADGNAGSATKLQTARSIILTGDATGTASFDGTANISISAVLTAASVLAKLLTVDGSGSGLDADLLDGHDSSYFLPATGNAPTASKLQTARTIALGGDASGSVTFDGSANQTITVVLANTGVVAGTYTKLTVDAKGRITSATTLLASDIPNLDWSKITSGKPTTLAGYGITDALLTTAYTAADVLAKLKTVDGSGSGVDADLFDGKESSAFAQNAFPNIKVGSTTVSAESPTDTVELVAGSNVTLTPDATNDKVTIAANVPVSSVNSKTGNVALTASDVGAETPAGAQAKADAAESGANTYSDQQLSIHVVDYVKHPGFGVTTNSGNAYSVTLSPAPTTYADGMGVTIKVNAASTGATTLNVNALGAKSIVKANGSSVSNLKANGVYSLRYNSATGNFILQGEGGEGTATAPDVLSGETFMNDSGDVVTGTMPNNGAVNQSLAINGTYTIPAGYHNGSGKVTQIVITKAAATITPGTADQTIAAAQYLSGAQTIKGDANLIPANILSGKSIFGVVGSVIAGKKFATGTSSSNMYSQLTISGLSFSPSVVIAYKETSGTKEYIFLANIGSLSNINHFWNENTSSWSQTFGTLSADGFTTNTAHANNSSIAWIACE